MAIGMLAAVLVVVSGELFPSVTMVLVSILTLIPIYVITKLMVK